MEIYYKKRKFDELDVVLKLFKKENRSAEQVLRYFDNADIKEYVKNNYPAVEPIHITEALKLSNSGQRMEVMNVMLHEEVLIALEGTRVGKQSAHTKQTRWDDQLQPYEFECDYIYELYEISPANLGIITQNQKGFPTNPSPIYVIKWTSANRTYYRYIPYWIFNDEKEAILAMAWTFAVNNIHLAKEQYLHCVYGSSIQTDMGKIERAYFQGEMFIFKLENYQGPSYHQKVSGLILQANEITGEAHLLTGSLEILQEDLFNEEIIFSVSGTAILKHIEHGTIVLEEGIYLKATQTKYNPFIAMFYWGSG